MLWIQYRLGGNLVSPHRERERGEMSRIPNILAVTALATGLAVVVGPSAWAAVLEEPGTCAGTGCATDGTAVTPDPMILHIDEFGNGTIAQNGGPTVPLTGALESDPSAPAGGGANLYSHTLCRNR
jgi:hypothetical protein